MYSEKHILQYMYINIKNDMKENERTNEFDGKMSQVRRIV